MAEQAGGKAPPERKERTMTNVKPSPAPGVLATVAGGLGVCLAGAEAVVGGGSLVPLGTLLLAVFLWKTVETPRRGS